MQNLLAVEISELIKKHKLPKKNISAIIKTNGNEISDVLFLQQIFNEAKLLKINLEDVMCLLNQQDLKNIKEKIEVFSHLSQTDTPLYNYEDLIFITEKFIDHLNKNKKALIKNGASQSNFNESQWLQHHLDNLYYTEIVDSQIGVGPNGSAVCISEEILTAIQKSKIKIDREKLFDLKINILKILVESIKQRSPDQVWLLSSELIHKNFSRAEIEFYLSLDARVYTGYFIKTGEYISDERTLGRVANNIVDLQNFKNLTQSTQTSLQPGGLTNILEVICHYENELCVGAFAKANIELRGILKNKNNVPALFLNSYLQVLGNPSYQEKIDSAIAVFLNLKKERVDFDQIFKNRLQDFLKPAVYEDENLMITKNGIEIFKCRKDFLVVYKRQKKFELTPAQGEVLKKVFNKYKTDGVGVKISDLHKELGISESNDFKSRFKSKSDLQKTLFIRKSGILSLNFDA